MSRFVLLSCLVFASSVAVVAQDQPAANNRTSENGAVNFYADSGWSFGLPAVRAAVSVPGLGSAISPDKKTLVAPDFGLTVTAWRFIVPFADVTIFDTGKASATVGSFTSQAQADTLAFNSGVRLVAGKSRVRAYAEFGGGVLHQNLSGSFSAAGASTSGSASASLGDFMYGGGVQLFAGRKWGTDIGFDGFHVGQPLNGAGQNFARLRLGIFFQTKSAVR
jgi:hypothetical protein